MQRGRVIGELDELAGTSERRRLVEEVGERDDRDDPAPALRARGDGRGVEVAGESEQRRRLVGVEEHLLAVVVQEHECGSGHGRTVAPVRRAPGAGTTVGAMQALVITPDATLRVEERPDPAPGAGEVLVRVHGAGLNRADLVQRRGNYAAPPGSPPDIPGLEFAGEVVAHGPGVTEPALGARVFGIAGGGSQAELLSVPAVQCAPVPDSLDLVAAGGVPEVFVTAHDAMVSQAALLPGQTLLVHAVGSGVGTAALQLGHAMGCTVVGTARTPEKLERCEALGLDHAVLAPRELDPVAFADAITAAAGPVDVILELVGGEYFVTDLRVAGPRGRIVLIGMMAGTRADADLGALMVKRLQVFGTVLRGRSIDEKAAATDAFTRDVVPLLASGAVAPVVARTFPLAGAPEAYDLLAADAVFGTIVLDLT